MPHPITSAPPQQSPRPTSAQSLHPLTPAERKAIASGWTALPVQSVSCFLLGFTNQLNIPPSELQPHLNRTLSKIPPLEAAAPIGSQTRRLELGQGSSALVQAIEQALVAYFSKRVLYDIERSNLAGITLELLSTTPIESATDLFAVVESGDLEISLSRSGAGDLAPAC